jgi:thiopurine S-methyltransferase
MIWLQQQQLRVKGIECSDLAVRNFFEENDLQASALNDATMPTQHANNIELAVGDFFQLDHHYFKDIDLVYDRAALIALNKTEREQYVAKLLHNLPKGADIFLVTLTYPEDEMAGPPFSLTAEDVCHLYSERYLCKTIFQQSILHKEPSFIDRGLSEMIETVYYLTEY